MTKTMKRKSIRKILLLSITGLGTILLVISVALLVKLASDDALQKQIKTSNSWAKFIAQQSVSYIQENEHDSFYNKLKALSHVPNINYIHIYIINNPNKDIAFFTSYNRNDNYPAIPDKISKIERLSIPTVFNDTIEYITPISSQNKIIGYVFIQTNLSNTISQNNKMIGIAILIASIAFILLLITSLKLRSQVNQTIHKMIGILQQILQSKDYSLRCTNDDYKELDFLIQNINKLLSRTEKSVKKQHETEVFSLEKNRALEEQIDSRTSALKTSNQELLSTLEKLHQFQGQLVESEKMASLGDMVAGVAHEVNTPIGLGVTASSLLADKLNEIKISFEDKTLKSSQLKKFLDQGTENIDIVYRNLVRAADLISSFKKVAVDQSSDEIQSFNVEKLINEVILTLAPKIKERPFTFTLKCASDLNILSKPGPLNQVLINLIMNSMIHGFNEQENCQITINVMLLSGQLNLQYQDNGIGVDETVKHKIFDPFTTTKRGNGGSGLGLHLVYNLITQALGGQIQIESEVGKGVIFDITFPVQSSV
jgi:signal transduction histidine kinase